MDKAIIFWAVLFLLLLLFSLLLVKRQKEYKALGIIAILMSLFPVTWVAIDCSKNKSSEACVWGVSFMPLYLGMALLVATPIGFLIYYLSKKLWLKIRAA